ncbi:MAG: homoserine dehydrogenase [Candidatus Levybacteria bacterium]|nr:homoserine dehydrogenase [Candidatus Levybacteria bacterium]
MAERIGVGVRGAGTVGGGVIRELIKNGPDWGLELRGVAVNNPANPNREFDGPHYTTSSQLLEDPNIKIIVEATGGVIPAISAAFMTDAMGAGKSVVTPAKAPVALYPDQLFEAARQNNVDFQFEGTVGGGIPVVNTLRRRTNVDRVMGITGIVNGTTNHILTQMRDRGMSFEDALAEAQAAGYAEADPTSDIEGQDAAFKLAILFMLGFNSIVNPLTIERKGISDVTAADLHFANNYVGDGNTTHDIKLLAIAKRRDDGLFEARVTPAIIRRDNPLASVNGVFNGVKVDWELADSQMYTGRGAGRDATTSAVLEDIRTAAVNLGKGPDDLPTLDGQAELEEPEDIQRAGYIRMLLAHKPMSAGEAYMIMGESGLNITDIQQERQFKTVVNGEPHIPDIVVFEPARQEVIQSALEDLSFSDRVEGTPVFIPFEG